MATFFHGGPPEIQSDTLQTLYLMNPGYVSYSEAAAPASMVLLNSTVSSMNPMSISQQPNQTQHFVGIPLEATAAAQDLLPQLQYNTSSLAQQGLSLSLTPQQAAYHYRPEAEMAPVNTGELTVSGSKYLKAAQQLLDEVVSVCKRVAGGEATKGGGHRSPAKGKEDEGETSAKRGGDLTAAERQELQTKKTKLVSMFDEVEQKYRQYHHQMQLVISAFEGAAGAGSARTYTALALQTISKQFRCLRDAISGQVRSISHSLGEEEYQLGGKLEVGSRLRFVDHHLRQQRALQQLGVAQQSAWRPQRGLPERSVSVLRAWLFEHFLHPYPKDSDKLMLAKQTGLTRSQVSNWFINARVRLWKPMVEEMYLEETKEQAQNNADDKASKSPTRTDRTDSPELNNDNDDNNWNPSPGAMHPSELENVPSHASYQQMMLKKPRGNDLSSVDIKPDERFSYDSSSGFGAYPVGDFGRFEAEQFTARFSGNNGVALSLGLPESEAKPGYISGEYHRLNNNDDDDDDNNNSGSSDNNIQSRKRIAAQLLHY